MDPMFFRLAMQAIGRRSAEAFRGIGATPVEPMADAGRYQTVAVVATARSNSGAGLVRLGEAMRGRHRLQSPGVADATGTEGA